MFIIISFYLDITQTLISSSRIRKKQAKKHYYVSHVIFKEKHILSQFRLKLGNRTAFK